MNLGWQAFCQTVGARGDHPALLMGDRLVTFRDLGTLARRYAKALTSRSVEPADRVILQLPNGPVAAALPAAIWAVGAVPVLVPMDLGKAALADITARTAPRLMLLDPDDLEGEDGFESALPGRMGSIVFTSGSTGRPKGVVQLQSTLIDGAARVAAAVGFHADDRLLCAVPWSHDYRWTQLLARYVLGLTLVLPASPGLALLPEAIERQRPTVIGGVPSVYAGLSRGVSDIRSRDRSSVRLAMSTGSAMPQRIWDDLATLFPGARRSLNYGLTETFRSATLRAADEVLGPRVVGSALPGSGLAIVDDAGEVLPAGEWGEIVHRGAGVFEGYWDDLEQTALRRRADPVTGQGFAVFTGDRGMLDEAGRLTVGDRIDRMVKVMGLTASPLAIEKVLRAVPGVEAAVVVSRPHDILGAELHAVLVGGDLKAAESACRAALAPHERPRRFHLREALPLTASGKVDLVGLTREILGQR